MKKKISTKTHGIIDYGTAAGLLALPRLLRMDPFVTKLLTGSAILTAVYSLFTNYELGLFKVLPMKAHLGLDAAQSAALAAAPIALARGESKKSALPLLLGISIIEAAVTMNTQKRPKRRFLGLRF